MMSIDQYDQEKCYCRTLGHDVPFAYCREVNDGLPCGRVLDCWFERLPIEAYLQEHFNDEQIERIFAPPRPKLRSLVDLIDQAKRRAANEKTDRTE